VRASGGALIITADHGNLEMMRDPATGQPHTAHTVGPVPLVYVGDRHVALRSGGALRDVAPTLLDLLRLAAAGRDERPEPVAAGLMRHPRAAVLLCTLAMLAGVAHAQEDRSDAERRLQGVRTELKQVAAERRKLEGARGDASRKLREADEASGRRAALAAEDPDDPAARWRGAARNCRPSARSLPATWTRRSRAGAPAARRAGSPAARRR
jgi:hypothetical protein